MLRLATPDDAEGVVAIYAPIVRDTIISFELEPPDADEVARRIEATLRERPWLVWDEGGRMLGYAYASRHRERAAYQWSVDVSAYVHPDARRRGLARNLYRALFELLARQGYRQAFAGITLPNPASVGFHEALGFRPVGVYRAVGFKLGAWHDVGWWQRPLTDDPGPPAAAPAPFSGFAPRAAELLGRD